jgi:hypothetical protein
MRRKLDKLDPPPLEAMNIVIRVFDGGDVPEPCSYYAPDGRLFTITHRRDEPE